MLLRGLRKKKKNMIVKLFTDCNTNLPLGKLCRSSSATLKVAFDYKLCHLVGNRITSTYLYNVLNVLEIYNFQELSEGSNKSGIS